jgi:hypothetical protein
MAEEPDLRFIARQLDRVLTEMGSMRDEIRVQGAMITRLEGTSQAVLEELRVIHSQIARLL